MAVTHGSRWRARVAEIKASHRTLRQRISTSVTTPTGIDAHVATLGRTRRLPERYLARRVSDIG